MKKSDWKIENSKVRRLLATATSQKLIWTFQVSLQSKNKEDLVLTNLCVFLVHVFFRRGRERRGVGMGGLSIRG